MRGKRRKKKSNFFILTEQALEFCGLLVSILKGFKPTNKKKIEQLEYIIKHIPYSKKRREKSVFTLKVLQKSDFQPATMKPDTNGHPTIQTGQFDSLSSFEVGFRF